MLLLPDDMLRSKSSSMKKIPCALVTGLNNLVRSPKPGQRFIITCARPWHGLETTTLRFIRGGIITKAEAKHERSGTAGSSSSGVVQVQHVKMTRSARDDDGDEAAAASRRWCSLCAEAKRSLSMTARQIRQTDLSLPSVRAGSRRRAIDSACRCDVDAKRTSSYGRPPANGLKALLVQVVICAVVATADDGGKL
jgi:hypothetical protein